MTLDCAKATAAAMLICLWLPWLPRVEAMALRSRTQEEAATEDDSEEDVKEHPDESCAAVSKLSAVLRDFVGKLEEIEVARSRRVPPSLPPPRASGGRAILRHASAAPPPPPAAASAPHPASSHKKVRLGSLDILPDDYDKRHFPPRHPRGEINVIYITLDIYSIPQLDEKKEEIMLEVRLSHSWYDTRIAKLVKPVELVPEAIHEFWTPDSYFHHAKDTREVKVVKAPASLRITPNKMIKYTMMTMVTIGCPMYYQYYPMDRQTCRLELQSFGYNLNYNNYTWKRAPYLKKDINLDNHEVAIEQYTFNYTSDGMLYPGLGVAIQLRRHLVYHIIQTYIPSIIYVTVAWLSFLVPSDIVPGRMVLCVTTLLTLTSMFNSVRTMTPQVSYMKSLDLWVFACICFVFSSLAEYGLILHLTSRSAWQKKVDAHIRATTGKVRLKMVTPVELLAITLRSEKKRVDEDSMDHPDVKDVENNENHASLRISAAAPVAPGSSAATGMRPSSPVPSTKERLAYTIEWLIKILYPLAFAVFNGAYWGFYLNMCNNTPSGEL